MRVSGKTGADKTGGVKVGLCGLITEGVKDRELVADILAELTRGYIRYYCEEVEDLYCFP